MFEDRRRRRTGVVCGTRGRGDDRAPVCPSAGLHGPARRETDGRVLTAKLGNGVVEDICVVEDVDVGSPEVVAVPRVVDYGAIGEDRPIARPRAEMGPPFRLRLDHSEGKQCSPAQRGRGEDLDTVASGEHKVPLGGNDDESCDTNTAWVCENSPQGSGCT